MTNKGTPRGSEATRIELLDLALQLALDDGLPLGLTIKVADVVRLAGRSLGSAYQIWNTQQAFREDLALHLASSVDHVSLRVVLPEFEDSLKRDDTLDELLTNAGGAFFDMYAAAPQYFVSRHFWTVATPLPREIEVALAAASRRIEDDITALLELLLKIHSRVIKDGFAIRDLARMVLATAQGLALDARFPSPEDEPGRYRALFVDSLEIFVEGCTERRINLSQNAEADDVPVHDDALAAISD